MKSPIAHWRDKKKYQYLNKTGRIISFTRICHPPVGFGILPYYSALIEFADGQKTAGQLVLDGKIPKIGAKVKGVLRIINKPEEKKIICYGVKFKLI